MKEIKYLLTSLLLIFSSISPVNADSSLRTPAKSSQKGYLFVQAARKATIRENTDETYTVILKRVMPYVTYFSDRPERYTNSMPIEDFLKLWQDKNKDGLEGDSPNVDFYGVKMKLFSPDQPFNLIFELSNPEYNAKSHTLQYKAIPLKNNKEPLPKLMHIQDVSLFIDNVCIACWD